MPALQLAARRRVRSETGLEKAEAVGSAAEQLFYADEDFTLAGTEDGTAD
jgi:hypothetical protein